MNKFIIIASQRTGSNMLISALNSLPQVCCHGELFRKRLLNKRGALSVLNDLDIRYQDNSYREKNFLSYLKSVQLLRTDCNYFGFKIMLNQSHVVIDYCIKSNDYKKILLFRDNVLAVYSSEKIALKTRQGNVKTNEPIIKEKVLFDADEFISFMSKYYSRYQRIRNQLTKHSANNYLEISYTQLTQASGIKNAIDYLDDRLLTYPVQINTKKRNSNNIPARFINSNDVLKYLKKCNKTHWETEQLKQENFLYSYE